jgi:murein DD-endopeptidase MepM/ murein hydrolase activator NlpD
MEENGIISYLEILFDSTSFADLLARWDFINDIMRADERLYRDLIAAREETQAAEEALRATRVELEGERTLLELSESELYELIEEANVLIEELMNTLEGEEALHQQKVTESRRINAEIDRLLEQQRREEEERRRRLAAQRAAGNNANNASNITGTGQLMWPTSGRVISEFGMRRGRMHLGIDIMAPVGTNIVAADSGTVVRIGYNAGGWGFFIMIDHGNGMRTTYGHLNCRGVVSQGQRVSRGQLIGFMGFSGNASASAPHLHLEVRVNGVDVNPRIHLP